jgi:hypothetical protein
MSGQYGATLEKASWLRRVIRVHLPDGEFHVEYSGRSLMHERILVNGQPVVQHRISSWFRPVSRFFAGSRPAAIALLVWPWLTIRSFHLLIDGQVLYCDRRRELFEGPEPEIVRYRLDASAAALDDTNDPLCPHCDRPLNGLGLDLAELPTELTRPDGPIGRPTAVFTFARRQRLALIVAGILAAVAGIGLLAALWFVLNETIGLLGILLLAVGPVLVLHARKYRRLHAIAGSEGVALVENDAVSSCRWQEVHTVQETRLVGEMQSVLQASARGEDHYFRVTCRDGKELVFRNFLDDLSWLGQIIHHETLPYLLPPAVAALEKGESLDFGPLCVDPEGLRSAPEKLLSWEEVKEVTVANGLLKVTRMGKLWAWFKTPLSQVPNAHVLLALVRLYRNADRTVDLMVGED